MNVLSVIKLLPESNEQVSKFSDELKDFLDSGNVNPLDVLLCIKGFEKVIKNVKDYLNDLSVDELNKYSEKDVKYKNAELKIVQTGVKYSFSLCGDPKWKSLTTEFEEKKNEIKGRETFLKSIKGEINVVDEETGEMVTIYEPSKTSTTSAKVTLK